MTIRELQALREALYNFRDWIDTKDAATISKMKTDRFALAVENQSANNKEKIDFVISCVTTSILNAAGYGNS